MVSVTNRDVLVLNKSWIPVHVCNIRRAITLIAQDIAFAVDDDYTVHSFDSWRDLSKHVEEEGNRFLRSPSFSILIPEVIILRDYGKVPNVSVRLNRRNIFLRDDNTCQYCSLRPESARMLTIDHVIPRSAGGSTTWENVALACRDCNGKKGNLPLHESGMRLLNTPRRPTWAGLLKKARCESSHPMWQQFVDKAYWSVTLDQ